ncbi:DnaJ domain-containing protein [Desulfosediminicola flagellatus]|uniref:DnaJ domain-containing protein n=1 Tax=Desulfosediminicola flagellatus TaxID=2569541 RepID=UPI0010AC634C|nr:DnaJ domain-containing protein [Desulfosediminicola flagellatus]
MKDYYQILEVTPESDENEIRKRYRKLAMQFHPDRNPDNPEAEARFKEVAEAYGVLTDPVKKKQYDRARKMGGGFSPNGQQGGFDYSQEDILRDLFKDPRFQQMFNGLLQEFARKGFRANQHFIKQSFFGGKGGILFGGLVFFGSIAGPAIMNSARKNLPGPKGLLRSLGSAVGSLLSGPKQQPAVEQAAATPQPDTTYTATLTADEFARGKTIQLITQGPNGQEKLKVNIPAGSRAGQKLRLKGKGRIGPGGRGDLYLKLES